MVSHKKHEDILDVQVRTRILDEYGNLIHGAIEYDPSTGYGKRIKDPALGLVESFFRQGGSVEIDGHNFDDTNQDEDRVAAIKDMITLHVNRNTPEYEDLLRQHVDQNRKNKHPPKDKNQQAFENAKGNNPDKPPKDAPVFKAANNIKKGTPVVIDWDTGSVDMVASAKPDNVFHANQAELDKQPPRKKAKH